MKTLRNLLMTAAMLIFAFSATAQSVRVEVGTPSGTADKAPFYNSGKAGTVQMLYSASEIGMEGTIDTLWFYCSTPGELTDTMLRVYMGQTELTQNVGGMPSANTFLAENEVSLVYSASSFTHPTAAGWVPIVLDNPFEYDGAHNLAVIVMSKRVAAVSSIKYATYSKTNGVLYRTVAGTYPPGGSASLLSTLPVVRFSISATSCSRPTGLAVSDIQPYSALLSWNQSGNFEVKVSTEGVEDRMLTVTDGSSIQLSGLTDNTAYTVAVRHLCDGETSSWSTIQFTTALEFGSVPYECNFDDIELNRSWVLNNGGCLNKWCIGEAAYEGESGKSLYISNDHGVSNVYTNTSQGLVYAQRPITIDEDGDYLISFDWHGANTNRSYMRVALVPFDETLTPAATMQNINIHNGIMLDNGPIYGSDAWSHYNGASASSVPAGNYYLVFAWTNLGQTSETLATAVDNVVLERSECGGVSSIELASVTGTTAELELVSAYGEDFMICYRKAGTTGRYDTLYSSSPALIENLESRTRYEVMAYTDCGDAGMGVRGMSFQFSTIATCLNITGVSVSNITTNGATISWTVEPGMDEIVNEYVLTIWRGSSLSMEFTTNETSFDVEDLREFTDYNVTVTAVCDEGNSVVTGETTFMTSCSSGSLPVELTGMLHDNHNVPLNEYYNYGYHQMLYLSSELGGARTIDSIGFQAYISNSYIHNRTFTMYMAHTSETSLDSFLGNLQFTEVFSGSYTFTNGWNMIPLQNMFSYNGTDNLIIAIDDNSGSYTSSYMYFYYSTVAGRCYTAYQDNVDLEPHSPSATLASNEMALSVRPNMKLPGGCEVSYSCEAPTVSVDEVTETSVGLRWTPGGSEEAWNVMYREVGTQEWVMALEEVSDAEVYVEDLEPNTDYEIRVIALCGGGDEGVATVRVHTYSFCPELIGLQTYYIVSDSIGVQWSLNRSTSLNVPDSYTVAIYNASGEEIESSSVEDTSYMFENLEPLTHYTVMVVSDCPEGSSDTLTLNVTTAEWYDPESVIYRETFENVSTLGDWTLANGTATNQWYIGNAVAYSGNKSLYISDYNGETNTYDISTECNTYAYVPVTFDMSGLYHIEFNWKSVGELNWDYISVGLISTSEMDEHPLSGADSRVTMTPTINITGNTTLSNGYGWQTYSSDFPVDIQGIYYLTFAWNNDDSQGVQPPAAIDNIMIRARQLDLCDAPDSVAVSNLDVHGATLTIYGEEEAGYQIVYKSTRETTYDTVETYSNTYTFENLMTNTVYEGMAYTLCAEGGASRFFVPFSFTLTDPESVIFTCDFESSGESSNWTLVNGTSTNHWMIGSGTYAGTEGQSLFITNNGSDNVYTINSTAAVWALRNITIPEDGIYQFVYDWKCAGESSFDYLKAYVIPSTTTPISGDYLDPEGSVRLFPGERLNLSGVWQTQESEVMLEAGTYKIAFLWRNDGSQGTLPPAAVDNISIRTIQTFSCSRPTSVTVSDATLTTATLEIESSSTENFMILYKADGAYSYDTVRSASPCTLTNLLPHTDYTGLVYSDCGEGDYSMSGMPFSFYTTLYMTMPFSEDFERTSLDEWVLENGTLTNKWYHGTAASNGEGTKGLYISNTNGSTNAYNNGSTSTVYAYVPINITTAGDYNYSYDWRCYGESSYDYMKVALVPDSYTPTAGTSTPSFPTNSILLHSTEYINQQNTWQTQSGMFTLTTPGAYNLVIVWRNDGSQGSGPAAIDNIVIAGDRCPAPISINVSDVTENSATVTVENGESDSVMLLFKPQTETVWDTIITGTTYTLENLTIHTGYQLKAYNYCGADGMSLNAVSTEFITLCGAISVIPWECGFEGMAWVSASNNLQYPECWSGTNAANNNSYWAKSTSDFSHQGQYAAMFKCNNSDTAVASNDMLIMPTFVLTGNNELMFYARGKGSRNHSRLQVRANSGSGYTSLPITNNQGISSNILDMTSDSYSEYTVNLGDMEGNVQLAFVVDGNSSDIYIDDVVLRERAACDAPESVAFVEASSSTATVTVTDAANTSWKIYYKATGDTLMNVVATTPTVELTGLLPNTQYQCYAVALCENGGESYPTATITFRTTCSELEIPIVESFENWNNGCWTRNNAAKFAVVTTEAYSGSKSLKIASSSTSSRAILATPPIADDIDGLNFTMAVKANGEGSIKVGVMTTPTTANTFSTMANINVNNEWQIVEIPLSNYAGDGHYIAIMSESAVDIYVDSLLIDNDDRCYRPFNISVNPGSETATVSWNPNGATNFEVECCLAGLLPGEGYHVDVANASMATVQDLIPQTSYDVYVRSNCGDSYSEWSQAVHFTTACGVISTYPYTQDFTDVAGATTYDTPGPLPDCWGAYSNGTNSAFVPHVTSSGSYHYGHGNSLTFTSGDEEYGNVKYVYLPMFDTAMSNLQISFWYGMENITKGTLSVGYMTSENVSSFSSVRDLTSYSGSTGGHTDSVQFTNAPANAKYIAFKWAHSSSYYSCGIDDIVVKVINNGTGQDTTIVEDCPQPLNVQSTPSANSCLLTWTGSGVGYQVGLRRDDSQYQYFTVIDTFYTFTPLQMNTQYSYCVRQICGLGDTSSAVFGSFVTTEITCPQTTGLQVTSTGQDYAIVTWNANPEVSRWELHLYSNTYDFYDTLTNNTATLYDLEGGVLYSVAVRSLCSDELTGDWCEPVAIYLSAGCPPVDNVTVSDITSNSASVDWVSVASVSQWELKYGLHGTSIDACSRVVVGNHPQVIHNLQANTQYDVYVRSICSSTEYGDWSPVTTFSTTHAQGIDDVESEAVVTISPNPASEAARIAVSGVQGDLTIVILDMSGREVVMQELYCDNGCVYTMDVTSLAKGTYFVRIAGANTNAIRKLVIY